MSLRDTSESIKEKTQKLKREVRATMQDLGGSLPRPLMERKTLILREPLLKQLRRRLEER